MQRFVELGKGYERDEFVADEDEEIELEEDQASYDSLVEEEDSDDESSSSDSTVSRSSTPTRSPSPPPLFQRMTRSRAKAQALEEDSDSSSSHSPKGRKKRQAEEEDDNAIYLSEPEEDEDVLASLAFSLDRHRLSFDDMYELHVEYAIKRLFHPRTDAALRDKRSKEYKQQHMLYLDRLAPQMEAYLKNLAHSEAWRQGVLKCVQELPFMKKKKIKPRHWQSCDACGRIHTVVSRTIFLWGAPCKENDEVNNAKAQVEKGYNVLKGGERNADDIPVTHQKTLFLGDQCARRLKLYHGLYHRDNKMFMDLMNDMQGAKNGLSRFRTMRHGKRVVVEPTAEEMEKTMMKNSTLVVSEKWAEQMQNKMKRCAHFAQGGKYTWNKKSDEKIHYSESTADRSDDDEEEDFFMFPKEPKKKFGHNYWKNKKSKTEKFNAWESHTNKKEQRSETRWGSLNQFNDNEEAGPFY